MSGMCDGGLFVARGTTTLFANHLFSSATRSAFAFRLGVPVWQSVRPAIEIIRLKRQRVNPLAERDRRMLASLDFF